MSRILLLETATEVCSAALAEEGRVLAFAEKSDGYKHAEQLTLFVEQLLTETGMTARDLDAVCVSRGPGSYTGLRIGVSTAKGLCYALQIPLLAVSTLDAMAHHVAECRIPDSLSSSDEVLLCPMLDARRMEVYSALYDSKGNQIADISARIIDSQSFEDILANKTIIFFGNGADKCKTQLTSSNAIFLEGVQASARFMSKLAQEHYNNNTREDVSYFEPFYLKDFMATVPRNKIF